MSADSPMAVTLCRFGALALSACVLGSCAVGPDFKQPAPPAVKGYLPQELPEATATSAALPADAQRFVQGMEVPRQWWKSFHSERLDALVEQALRSNPSVQQAQGALRQANENYYAQLGSLLPAAQAQYSVERQQNATGTLAPTLTSGQSLFTLHTAQVTVTYALDVFGQARRQAESARALADSQRFQLEATYLTLISNVVSTAIQQASARAQLEATQRIVQSQREALEILTRQNQLGSIAQSDVMAQEATVATTEATLPALEKQVRQADHALAILAGQFPADAPISDFELETLSADKASADPSTLALPDRLPVSVPSRLVRQRPDVLSAEAQLHSATAQVGVAIADMLPQISLAAMEGGASTQVNRLFAAGNTFWSGGATLTQTVFSGGALYHKEKAARAALDQAGAQYRTVVLTAFQNVADTLTALQLDAQAVGAGVRALRAAENNLTTVRRNVELGLIGYLALLSAQQTYQQAVVNLIQAQANRYSDTAALFQALGGGWQTPEKS